MHLLFIYRSVLAIKIVILELLQQFCSCPENLCYTFRGSLSYKRKQLITHLVTL